MNNNNAKSGSLTGGILLVTGTSIGAGMLALPVMTAFTGFFPSLLLLGVGWLFMFITALLLLEVSLAIEGESNMISMAQHTLGRWGQAVSWPVIPLLLYSFTAAYIAGSAPLVLQAYKAVTGTTLPEWVGPLPLLIIFGPFVYFGTKSVDYINRPLMLGLVFAYIALVIFVPQHLDRQLLTHVDMKPLLVGLPTVISAFSTHNIIPSLTTYMGRDRGKLRLVLLFGTLIPCCVYALWECLILGAVPLKGDHGLLSAWIKGEGATGPLVHMLNNQGVKKATQLFSFFAITTSFLGMSLSLSDFLIDGFQIKRSSSGRFIACMLTFTPPLLFVYTYQKAFFKALNYNSVFVAIACGLLPALMAWTLPKTSGLRSFFGRCLLITVLIFFLLVAIVSFMKAQGSLDTLIEHYTKA